MSIRYRSSANGWKNPTFLTQFLIQVREQIINFLKQFCSCHKIWEEFSLKRFTDVRSSPRVTDLKICSYQKKEAGGKSKHNRKKDQDEFVSILCFQMKVEIDLMSVYLDRKVIYFFSWLQHPKEMQIVSSQCNFYHFDWKSSAN